MRKASILRAQDKILDNWKNLMRGLRWERPRFVLDVQKRPAVGT